LVVFQRAARPTSSLWDGEVRNLEIE